MFDMKKILFGIAAMLPLFGITSASEDEIKKRMMSDLDTIRNIFEVQYAPKEWKKTFFGWDLDTEINRAKKRIYQTKQINLKDYQKIVKDFFNSVHDYHVMPTFYSTEAANLPFSIRGVNNRYYFTYIDRARLSYASFPFSEGDEILLFDERPIHEVVVELQQTDLGSEGEGTDRALAEIYLTNRMGSFAQTIPQGPISLQIKPLGSNQPVNHQLIWTYTPEKFISKDIDFPAAPASTKELLLKKEWVHPIYQQLVKNSALKEARNPHNIGAKRSFIPLLGQIWWMTDDFSSFFAYLYETPDHHRIGYIRIPIYQGGAAEIEEFAEIMHLFENRTDALIIDQINNPGGNVFYMYTLASMLTDQSLKNIKHRMSITHDDIALALEWLPVFEQVRDEEDAADLLGESFSGYPVTYQMAQYIVSYLRFILNEWNQGKTLTDPYYLFGVDNINPNPYARYTKPILVLVNELDFSCGDSLPAILQDNHRAIIMGTRTAGAGGYVNKTSFLNKHGLAQFTLTGSITERVNHQTLENLGVTPDILYELSEIDYQFGYPLYAEAISSVINALLQQ